MKSKILSHFDVIKSYVEDNIIEACAIIALVIVLIGVLIGSGSLSVHAAVNEEIMFPTSIPIKSGYVPVPQASQFPFPCSRSDVEELATIMNELSSTPFRYRFNNDGYTVYLNNFVVVEDSSTSWRIVCDNAFVSSQTAFRITASVDTSSIVADDLLFVCTTDTVLQNFDVFYLVVIDAMSQYGFCPTPLYFIDYSACGGGSIPTVCPTLPEMLANYTGSFESIVDMLNPTNYDEYDAWVNEVAQDARDAGKQEGLQEGFNIGKDAGYMEGEVDGFQDGYNKGTSDALVKGFFANLFGGIIEAFEKVEFYNDGSLVINFWTIFCSVVILSVIIILLKVWRGG